MQIIARRLYLHTFLLYLCTPNYEKLFNYITINLNYLHYRSVCTTAILSQCAGFFLDVIPE